MIFGRCGMLMKVSRCNIAACSMKPAITPPMDGRQGRVAVLSLFAGRREDHVAQAQADAEQLAYGISSTTGCSRVPTRVRTVARAGRAHAAPPCAAGLAARHGRTAHAHESAINDMGDGLARIVLEATAGERSRSA